MSAATVIIEKMRLSGLSLSTDGNDLIIAPPGRLTGPQRDYLRKHKAELLAALQPPANTDALPARLATAAERVCRELHGDGDAEVGQMLEDLRHYPPSDYPALARHFELQLTGDDFDNLRTCRDCLHLSSTGSCRAAQRGEIPTATTTWRPDPERLRRCVGYSPKAYDPDPRHGLARWPGVDRAPGIQPENPNEVTQ